MNNIYIINNSIYEHHNIIQHHQILIQNIVTLCLIANYCGSNGAEGNVQFDTDAGDNIGTVVCALIIIINNTR